MASKPKARRLAPECPNCGGPCSNHGAESRGDGDIYDVWWCRGEGQCGPVLHIHADYCKCGCGGGHVESVYDPEFIPDFGDTGP